MLHLNFTHLDWLALSSWQPWLLYDHASRSETGRMVRRMQYKGLGVDVQDAGVDVGTRWAGAGEQQHQSHYRLEATGYAAHLEALHQAHAQDTSGAYATRIDICRTAESPYQSIDDLQRHFRQIKDNLRARTVTLFESDTGYTLYIGSRRSDRMIRIYTKHIDQADWGLNVMLRFELEYKHDKAKALWSHICAWYQDPRGDKSMDELLQEVLMDELDRRSDLGELRKLWRTDTSDRTRIAPIERPDGRRVWLETTVMPWLEKMADDHDIGDLVKYRVRELCRAWN